MPSMVDDLRSIVEWARAVPGEMGLREYAVELRHTVWSQHNPGDGAPTTTVIPIKVGGQNPKVRWLSPKELALGALPVGTIEIGPVTPSCSAGGVAVSDLLGQSLEHGTEQLVWIQGPKVPDGAFYRITAREADHALRLTLRCELAGASPGAYP